MSLKNYRINPNILPYSNKYPCFFYQKHCYINLYEFLFVSLDDNNFLAWSLFLKERICSSSSIRKEQILLFRVLLTVKRGKVELRPL